MSDVQRPSLWLTALEGRSFYELAVYCISLPLLQTTPGGDGHPVLVLPGFMASDLSTTPLRGFLKSRGYKTSGWEFGRNYGHDADIVNGLAEDNRIVRRVLHLHHQHQEKISLIGWSLGGVFAREIARKYPDSIRQVITLGSPFSGNPKANNIYGLFEYMSGKKLEEMNPALQKEIASPLPVPTTSIYTRTDGIVAWQCCIDERTENNENIGVPGSHAGLGHNPAVLWIIADRLAQQEGKWRPFDKSGLKRLMFTDPEHHWGLW